MKIAMVEWLDAVTTTGSYNKEHPEKFDAIRCKTVGYLIRNTKKDVVVSTEYFDDGECRNIHTIPKKMVTKISYLVVK